VEGQATEGQRTTEDLGAAPAGLGNGRDAARKRVFFQLDSERRSLAARPGPRWRPVHRYEDLSLAAMLARLERGWLSGRTAVPLDGGEDGEGDRRAFGLAGWANPWGTAPRMKLDADLEHLDEALGRLGRWLPPGATARARGRARSRLEATAARLLERDPGAWTATSLATEPGGHVQAPRHRARVRVVALAALLLLVAATVALLVGIARGPSDEAGPPRVAHAPGHTPPAHRARAEPAGRQQDEAPGGPRRTTQSRAGSRSGTDEGGAAAPTATASPTAASPTPPQPTQVATPAPAPAPASPPAPPAAGASPPSTPPQGAEASSSCPPEFGYEC
jgi:hypothetical protein